MVTIALSVAPALMPAMTLAAVAAVAATVAAKVVKSASPTVTSVDQAEVAMPNHAVICLLLNRLCVALGNVPHEATVAALRCRVWVAHSPTPCVPVSISCRIVVSAAEVVVLALAHATTQRRGVILAAAWVPVVLVVVAGRVVLESRRATSSPGVFGTGSAHFKP